MFIRYYPQLTEYLDVKNDITLPISSKLVYITMIIVLHSPDIFGRALPGDDAKTTVLLSHKLHPNPKNLKFLFNVFSISQFHPCSGFSLSTFDVFRTFWSSRSIAVHFSSSKTRSTNIMQNEHWTYVLTGNIRLSRTYRSRRFFSGFQYKIAKRTCTNDYRCQ